MPLFDEWLKRNGQLEHTPIELKNVSRTIAEKAALIDINYIAILGTEKFNKAWEIAESAVVNLRDVTEIPALKKFQIEQRPICEAVIQAFDVEIGAFPTGFDAKTGQYRE